MEKRRELNWSQIGMVLIGNALPYKQQPSGSRDVCLETHKILILIIK